MGWKTGLSLVHSVPYVQLNCGEPGTARHRCWKSVIFPKLNGNILHREHFEKSYVNYWYVKQLVTPFCLCPLLAENKKLKKTQKNRLLYPIDADLCSPVACCEVHFGRRYRTHSLHAIARSF